MVLHRANRVAIRQWGPGLLFKWFWLRSPLLFFLTSFNRFFDAESF